MPADSLSLSLTTGISFTLAAGIVSGVCYLLTNKLIWRGDGKEALPDPEEDEEDEQLLHPPELHWYNGPLRNGRHHRGFEADFSGEIPRPLKFKKGKIFLDRVRETMNTVPWGLTADEYAKNGGNGDKRRGSGSSVREVLEQLSSRLTGGPLDSTSVERLSVHPAYRPRPRRTSSSEFSNRSVASAGQNDDDGIASNAHARLKKLVSRVVEEAISLPALAQYSQQKYDPDMDHSSYEDLLATAILNKVITRYQTEGAEGSSGVHSASHTPSPTSTPTPPNSSSSNARLYQVKNDEEGADGSETWDESETEVNEEGNLVVSKRVPFPEFGGDIIHPFNGEDDDESACEMSGGDLQAVGGSWEGNWLFQKKKINAQPMNVPMLVPNSNTDYRAMIGDVDAEETSDLSDLSSDQEEIDDTNGDIKKILVKSRTKIGGKLSPEQLNIENIDNNSDDKITRDEYVTDEKLISRTSKVILETDSGPLNVAEYAVEEIHRRPSRKWSSDQAHLDEMDVTSKRQNLEEGKLQDEATLDIVDGIASHDGTASTIIMDNSNLNKDYKNNNEQLEDKHILDDYNDSEHDLIPGSVADRERKKWLNYVDMPNNPYSADAIKKRLNSKSTSSIFDTLTSQPKRDEVDVKDECDAPKKPNSPQPKILEQVLSEEVSPYKRFGRDYYINEAKRSTGSRKKNLSSSISLNSIDRSSHYDGLDSNGFTSPKTIIQHYNEMAVEKQAPVLNSEPKDGKMNQFEEVNEQTLFSAKTVIVDDDTERQFEELVQTIELDSEKSELSDDVIDNNIKNESMGEEMSSLTISSPDDSLKIYNVQTGAVVKPTKELDVETAANVKSIEEVPVESEAIAQVEEKCADELEEAVIVNHNKEVKDTLTELPKVKVLAKKFSECENRKKELKSKSLDDLGKTAGGNRHYMHSLTARSISKEFRDELKYSKATPLKTPGGANHTPEGVDDISKEGKGTSPKPEPGTLKSKLAFFESLRSSTLQTLKL